MHERCTHYLRAPLVVSLTSYPMRYATLRMTLDSLLAQTIVPDHLVLWISKEDMISLPRDVLVLRDHGLEIRLADDTKSYKKILPTIDAFPSGFICTADDDLYYVPTWLEELVSGICSDSTVVPCHRAHRIKSYEDGVFAPYKDWQFNVLEREEAINLFPTSGAGVLFPPGILSHSPADRQVALDLCPTADDVWLYWIGRRNGARYKTIGTPRQLVMWNGSQEHRLWRTNIYGGANDEQIRKIARIWGYPSVHL